MCAYHHRPVLMNAVLDALQPAPGKTYIDGTLGGGGHTTALLQRIQPGGTVLALDADPAALQAAQAVLEQTLSADASGAWNLVHGNFCEIGRIARSYGYSDVDGILLDIGVSSHQVDTPERGFSFSYDGPLDMRFDPTSGMTAAELIATVNEQELADMLYQYGEERQSRRIAQHIVAQRQLHPITTTAELVACVMRATSGRRSTTRSRPSHTRRMQIHPATRTFQALRIAVNNELAHLEMALSQAVDLLRPGGRLAVISFHSLEDRIVKLFFRAESGYGGSEAEDRPVRLGIITKKPIQADDEEVTINPRSRSAKLRVAERV